MECELPLGADSEMDLNSTLDYVESDAARVTRIINTKLLPSVGMFGIVGNLLNLTILTRRKLQKSFRTLEQAANLCLIALALSDLMFCVMAFVIGFLPYDGRYLSRSSPWLFYQRYLVAVINVFIMESTLLTVAMSLERFMAICFPLRQDLYLTTRRIKYVIVFTAIFSVLFNVPVLWRYKVVAVCGYAQDMNSTDIVQNTTLSILETTAEKLQSQSSSTMPNVSKSFIVLSSLRECAKNFNCNSSSFAQGQMDNSNTDPLPAQSSSSSSLLSTLTRPMGTSLSLSLQNDVLTPVNVSAIFNIPINTNESLRLQPLYYKVNETNIADSEQITSAYRWAWALFGNFIPLILLFYFNVCLWRKIYLSYKMRRQFHRPNQTTRSSHILTLTLIAIVVMFFILVAPSETVLQARDYMDLDSDTRLLIETVFNLMQAINFSVNFILYCIISPYFRKTLKYIMLCGFYNVYQVSKDWKKEFETSLM